MPGFAACPATGSNNNSAVAAASQIGSLQRAIRLIGPPRRGTRVARWRVPVTLQHPARGGNDPGPSRFTDNRDEEALAGTYLAAFVGLSLPIIGAGVALAAGVSPRVTLLGFGIAVSIGIVASAIKLLPAKPNQALRPAVAEAR